jgi:hypothetical protein
MESGVMSWTVNEMLSEAVNEHGYRITWAHNKHGTWHNAYAPSGAHVEAGYDRAKVEAQCVKHYDEVLRKRAMRAAKKQAKEVSHETPAIP